MKTAFSCVVDATPKFEWQAFLWAHSLIRNACCRPEDLKVHCLPGVSKYFREAMAGMNIGITDIRPFEGGHAYCNKIQQCFSGAFDGYDSAVLTDTDMFFLAAPALPQQAPVAGMTVRIPNPPLRILRAVYSEAAVTPSAEIPVSCALSPEEITFRSNLNGGFYFIKTAFLQTLGTCWKKWAIWLIDRIELLETYKAHVDQIAMSLALDELRLDFEPLTSQANFSINLMEQRLQVILASEKLRRIDVLHYHTSVLPGGTLTPTNLPFVDEAIALANRDISAVINAEHNNYLFWNFRYHCFPGVGSGVGSRGEILQQKKNLLYGVVPLFYDTPVLEVGCGDLETSREFPFSDYTGYDLSPAALDIARRKRPDWRFVEGTLPSEEEPKADLVICLDVLIHQKKEEEYRTLVSGLVGATLKRLIVSGYQQPPSAGNASDITVFHEPLGRTLRSCGVFCEVMEIGRYRDVSLIVADRIETGPQKHPNDLPLEIFNDMASYVDRPAILRMVMDHSRALLGFYTQTSSRMIEYPWVVDRMRGIPAGSRALEIGSGISPLPHILASRGLKVACVDNHPMVRTLADRHEWNEWGFFDYSVLSPDIQSYHTDICDFRPEVKFDAVYSVSVLEHMPRQVWEQTLMLLPHFLKPGGRLLLTLDLIPGTYDLWNMCSGKIVDQNQPHGTLKEMTSMLQSLGFVLDELNARQRIPHSRTDVALLSATLRG